MPTVKFYQPEASLQWIVKQFETIRHDNINRILTDKFIPRPDAALVFHFKNIPSLIAPVQMKLRPFFMAPVVSVPNQLYMQGQLDGFIVVCKASVLSRLFKPDTPGKSKIITELPAGIFAPLWEKLDKAGTDRARIACFTKFIQSHSPGGYTPDAIDMIYDAIADNIQEFSLQDIHTNASGSLSRLQRNFNKRLGVSMKRLMRIARINYLFKNMLKDQCFNAQKMMFDGNYYDQSHFIKEFKELTGETPKQFFGQNTELCRTLSGIFKDDLISG